MWGSFCELHFLAPFQRDTSANCTVCQKAGFVSNPPLIQAMSWSVTNVEICFKCKCVGLLHPGQTASGGAKRRRWLAVPSATS